MFRRLLLGSSMTIAVLALLVSQWAPPSALRISTIHQGRNNTVLFLTNSELGLSNVLVATADALLQQHPQVQVHFASFPLMGPRLGWISEKRRSARSIVFHELPDLSFLTAMGKVGLTLTDIIHPPGLAGVSTICRDMPFYVSPWSGEDHITLFQEAIGIIDEVDPALVVLDTFLRPAIDATRNRSRLHAFISPLTPLEIFPLEQPHGSWLWKYPVYVIHLRYGQMGNWHGLRYTISCPMGEATTEHIINIRYFYAMLRMPHYIATQKYLQSKGLTDPVSWFNMHNADVPWFTQALPEASTPLDVIPPNVTYTGPIILSLSPAEEQSPVLTEWLARAPTVLINLGGLFQWTEGHATVMVQAVVDTLLARSDLQVLWKFRKAPRDATGTTYGDEFMAPLRPFLESGRIKMESWLEVEPTSLMETGHIVASVHHGGAGCYHEALRTGVAQIVLPQWLDHYNFAQLAEDVGVGVWGCREASPYWAVECLRDAFSTIMSSEAGERIREAAKRFGEVDQSDPGQYFAAREIAKLAASGYGS
ncbi:glycosyltransferase family 1 protein [Xylariaceae sp. AK1471]|nr:glycosyltransferase family 1 protein [Xylariaceae sp. AK1471]